MPAATDINPATGKAYAINPQSGVWDDNYFAKTYSGAKNVAPTTSFSTPDLSGFVNSFKSGISDVNKNAANTENDFLSRFRSAISGQEALPAMAERIRNELGIPQLTNTSTTLNTLLQNMPYTQAEATRGTDVNQNQLDRIIASEAAALAPTATAEANKLTAATNLAGQEIGYGVQQQQKELTPFTTEAGMISDRAAREVAGYTTGMQAELTTLLEQMRQGVQISEAAKQRANDLAMKESDYTHELEKPSNRYIQVGTSLYDTTTGSWIKAPSATGTGITTPPPATSTAPTQDFSTILNNLFTM